MRCVRCTALSERCGPRPRLVARVFFLLPPRQQRLGGWHSRAAALPKMRCCLHAGRYGFRGVLRWHLRGGWLLVLVLPACLPAHPLRANALKYSPNCVLLGVFCFFFAQFVTSEHSAILVLPDCGRGHFLFLFFVLMARCTSYVFPARSRAGYLGGELDSDADLVKVLHVPSA